MHRAGVAGLAVAWPRLLRIVTRVSCDRGGDAVLILLRSHRSRGAMTMQARRNNVDRRQVVSNSGGSARKSCRILLKSRSASFRAKIVGPSGMFDFRRSLRRINLHSTNWITLH